ncbi:MAG: cobalamin B12-binding domain-containing protein [Deltaproteobacteria bacterium]|nr:cobalamin B12-binding domain-containing protein [Deltaproteobacteria bacterium]
MKILLMSNIVENSAQSNPEWTAENDSGSFSPSGLMYIAGYLRQHAPHHEIKLLDANLLNYSQEDIRRDISAFMPDIVGMTVYTDILYDTFETVKVIKSISKDIKIMMGGAHPTNHPMETMEMPGVDYVCVGEGEITFAEFIEALEGKRELSGIPGILWRNEYEKYYSMIGTGAPTGIICSSRGCPYRCTFCSKAYSSYRSRSVDNIMEEMQLYYDRGIREFMFFDDMFNLPAQRALAISQAIRSKFPDIQWCFRGRADQITEELAQDLRKSNCKQVSVGAEAHTDEGQKELKTGKSVEKTRRAVQILRKNKIKSNTNWIIGLPSQKSEKDMDDLIRVVLETDSDYVQFSVLMLWDDTQLYREAVETGVISANLWPDYIKNPIPNFLIPAWEKYVPRSIQAKYVRKAYRKHYFRFRTFYRQMLDVKTLTTFKVKLRGFLILLVPLFYPVLRVFKSDFSKRKRFLAIQN